VTSRVRNWQWYIELEDHRFHHYSGAVIGYRYRRPGRYRVRLVVTEGNYLLLEAAPWSAIRGLLDEVWFLAPDEQTRHAWLTTRHRRYGRTAKQAAERTSGSDERNARLIAPTASRADLILDPPGRR